jgi:hypothetical protein
MSMSLASTLNFNDTIKKSFGKRYGLESEQAFSIQFASISEGTASELMAQADLPQHIQTHIVQDEDGLTQAEYDDPRFSYRVAFGPKSLNLLWGKRDSSAQRQTAQNHLQARNGLRRDRNAAAKARRLRASWQYLRTRHSVRLFEFPKVAKWRWERRAIIA